jgi:hypothetical protein
MLTCLLRMKVACARHRVYQDIALTHDGRAFTYVLSVSGWRPQRKSATSVAMCRSSVSPFATRLDPPYRQPFNISPIPIVIEYDVNEHMNIWVWR